MPGCWGGVRGGGENCLRRALYRRERENEGGQPDAVLTFEELKGWLEEEEIKIDECEDADFDERHLGANPAVSGQRRAADFGGDDKDKAGQVP